MYIHSRSSHPRLHHIKHPPISTPHPLILPAYQGNPQAKNGQFTNGQVTNYWKFPHIHRFPCPTIYLRAIQPSAHHHHQPHMHHQPTIPPPSTYPKNYHPLPTTTSTIYHHLTTNTPITTHHSQYTHPPTTVQLLPDAEGYEIYCWQFEAKPPDCPVHKFRGMARYA